MNKLFAVEEVLRLAAKVSSEAENLADEYEALIYKENLPRYQSIAEKGFNKKTTKQMFQNINEELDIQVLDKVRENLFNSVPFVQFTIFLIKSKLKSFFIGFVLGVLIVSLFIILSYYGLS